jgi:signal transduction histidine kinase
VSAAPDAAEPDPTRAGIFEPQLGVGGLLGVVKEVVGTDAAREIFTALGVSEETAKDAQPWFSLAFVEQMLERVAATAADPEVIERIGKTSLSARHLGFLYVFLRAFGSPEFTYGQLAKSTARFNKVGTFASEQLTAAQARLVYRPVEGAPRERTDYLCRIRQAHMAAIPTMFDLPAAQVTHPTCLLRGSDRCVYEISWTPAQSRRISRFAALLGFGVAFGLGALLAVDPAIAFAAGSGAALLSWSLGRTVELKRELQERARDISDRQDALGRSMIANEKRFAELLEAKAEVEKRVEQRTAELRRATRQLSTSLDEIQALDRAKTDFFNNVSHELRSPLTLLLAPLEDLVAGRAPPGGHTSAFSAMQRNGARLLRLINQLLDLAKIDAGEMKLSPVATDIVGLVRSALAGFDAAAQKKQVRLSLMAPEPCLPITIDPAWIESAVINLVANALRVTAGGMAVRVAIVDDGAEVSISVADEGPGIPAQEQSKIFERFAQGDSGKRIVGGTGIGLALVRESARLHGGNVRLASEPGLGATFTLILPRRSVALAIAPDEQAIQPELVAPAQGERQCPPSAWHSSLLVEEPGAEVETSERAGPMPTAPLAFVVEDNHSLREFLADVLAVRYRVHTFHRGSTAVSMARKLRPDVVVSDVAMSEMNGYEVCRALRAQHETRSVPILLVTARTELSSVLAGFDAGASDYVVKPFHGRELLARVDVHVRLRRMVQQLALRERHAMLGALAASIAHQVLNPLTTIVSGLPAMRARLEDRLASSEVELIAVMLDCAARIERIAGDLMVLSRVDRETRGPFRPSDGLRAAIRMIRSKLNYNVVIEEHIEDCPQIDGRAGDMNHVFMNLLDNAIRAVDAKGRIRIQASTQASAYTVAIEDSGPGVDDETAQKVFEPFFTTRPAGQGTGLGLAIARQVLEQCDGEIELGRSELGGAAFTVAIPLTHAASTRE